MGCKTSIAHQTLPSNVFPSSLLCIGARVYTERTAVKMYPQASDDVALSHITTEGAWSHGLARQHLTKTIAGAYRGSCECGAVPPLTSVVCSVPPSTKTDA